MSLHNAKRNGQAQAGALANRLTGIKRLKNSRLFVRRNATTRVLHLDPDRVGLHSGAHGNGPTFRNGLTRIGQEVHHHLVDLRGHTTDQGQGHVFAHHIDLVFQLIPDHVDGAFNAGLQICGLNRHIAGAGKVLQVRHDLAHALHALHGFVNQLLDVIHQKLVIDVLFALLNFLQCPGHSRALNVLHVLVGPHDLKQGIDISAQ